MVKATQPVSLCEQNPAENCSEDAVTLVVLLGATVRTSRPLTCQVITCHGPGTVALNRTVASLRTAVLAGSSTKSWARTEQETGQR